MQRTWRTRVVVTPLAVIALVAPAACGGTSGGSSGGAPPPKANVNQINALAADKVQDGGKLTWPLGAMPANFNPSELDGTLQALDAGALGTVKIPLTTKPPPGTTTEIEVVVQPLPQEQVSDNNTATYSVVFGS